MALRILIVEDDGLVLDALVEMARSMGHEAIGCTRASIAIDLLKDHAYDFLLAEYKLPGMSGIDLMKWAMQCREMYLVLTSSLQMPSDLPEGIQWLAKPFGVEDYESLLIDCSSKHVDTNCHQLPMTPASP